MISEGVTRNFLTILESDVQRSAKSLLRIGGSTLLVSLVAYTALHPFPYYGIGAVGLLFLVSFVASYAFTRFFILDAYEVSLRDHWNRWMRWSVSCKTVRECYAKVHNQSWHPSWWVGGVLFALLLLAHLVLGILALNEEAGLAETLPLFGLDSVLLGLFAGRRYLERQWYQRFLRTCNQLLRDGKMDLWGVY